MRGLGEPGRAHRGQLPAGDTADLNLDSSERMGLVVVSHLAARHQVRVQLRSGHTGTSAYVRVPDDLLMDEGALG